MLAPPTIPADTTLHVARAAAVVEVFPVSVFRQPKQAAHFRLVAVEAVSVLALGSAAGQAAPPEQD
jgi:hypothetical protein